MPCLKCVCRFVGRSLRASRLCSAGFRAGKREARCLRVPAQWAAWPTAPLCLRLVPTAKTVQSRLLFLRFFVGRALSRWLKLSEFARLFLEGVCSFRTRITFQFVECSFLVIAGSNSTLQSHPASFFLKVTPTFKSANPASLAKSESSRKDAFHT